MDEIKIMPEKKLWESLHSIEDEIKAAEDKIRHLRKIHEELVDEINSRQNYDDMYAVKSNDRLKVVLTYAGEGYFGTYDENDPDDAPMLRLEVYVGENGVFPEQAAESVSTLLSADINESLLTPAIDYLFAELEKTKLEDLSEKVLVLSTMTKNNIFTN